MQNTNKNKFTSFMKKYGTYCVAGVLVLAMAITICVAGAASTPVNVDENEPSVETSATVLSFGMPMENTILSQRICTAIFAANRMPASAQYQTMDSTGILT